MIKLINKLQSKFSSIYLMVGLFVMDKMAFALSTTGVLPDTIIKNTDIFEAGLIWILRIGGIGAVIYGGISFARNKLQGHASDTLVMLIIGLGGAASGISWWVGAAKDASNGFIF